MKDVEFAGSSDDDLRDFPQVARHRAGYQLHLVQSGRDPFDWKPMATVGSGCTEIRVRDAGDAYGIFFVADNADTVNVLHCFHNKSEQTGTLDIDVGRQRYKELKELILATEAT